MSQAPESGSVIISPVPPEPSLPEHNPTEQVAKLGQYVALQVSKLGQYVALEVKNRIVHEIEHYAERNRIPNGEVYVELVRSKEGGTVWITISHQKGATPILGSPKKILRVKFSVQ
ncbi:MAG TPA: hypothetical protein VNL14_16775 [Candidatus Acidoferrales bacterium]|nr:hypothetical protein [Candidatus Acidoferrales bacterium]